MMTMIVRNLVLPGLTLLLMLSGLVQVQAQAPVCMDSVDDHLAIRTGKSVVPVTRVAEYIAVIGKRDLHNSSGTRLTDYRAILQQDRANLHNSGVADRFDDVVEDVDNYFTTLNRRKLLSTAQYYFDCWMSPETVNNLQNDIEAGQVAGLISVVVFRQESGTLAITISLVG